MTVDVIAAARRRTRRALIGVGIAVGVLACAIYPAGLYVNSRLDDAATVPTTAVPLAPWPVKSGPVPLPADTTWQRVAGVALPVSAAAGPRDQRGGLVRGFTHTPAGAVFAALHLLVRTTPQVGPAVFVPTLRDQVVGEHAQAMRAAVAVDYRQLAGAGTGGPVGPLPAALAGARLAAYTDTDAAVDLLTTAVDATGTARYAATTVHVTWTGGDWALIAPPGGRWDSVVTPVGVEQAAAYPPLGPALEGP
jgi:hypothetical protein